MDRNETDTVHPVDRGRRAVARRTRVNTDPHTLFELLADPHRHHEADGSGSVKPQVIGPRELREGDRFRVDMAMYGIPYAITSVTTRVEPDRLVEWRHPGKHLWRWEFEPAPEGGTLVTETFDYSASPVAGLLERMRRPERNADSITKSLLKLQRRFAN